MRVAGVDGCKGGWVVAFREPPNRAARVVVVPSFADVLEATASAGIVAVDVPMGLLEAAEPGGRQCDHLARAALGRGRASSVFSPPVRAALPASSYTQALILNRESSPFRLGVSKQCFHLFPKMLEVDVQLTRQRQMRIREAHPELSFQWLNQGRPLIGSKHSRAGRTQRQLLLQSAGFPRLQSIRWNRGSSSVLAPHDVLDAMVLCWTAARIAAGRARALPRRADRDARGLAMQIWI